MNYNQEYINQFGEEYLLDYLKTKNQDKLGKIYESYMNEFKNDRISETQLLLIKESIDHLIVKKINEDDNFINSEEFNNYIDFIKGVFEPSIFNRIATELFTNPVFLDKKSNSIILDRTKINSRINYLQHIHNVKEHLQKILDKMNKGDLINQNELDSICRILARKNTPSDNNYQIVMTYILRHMKNHPSLKINLNELAFIACMMPFLYSEYKLPEGSIKNVRVRIGDILRNNRSVFNASYIGYNNYVQIGKKLAEKCTSLKKESIYSHRDILNISDIYSFMFVCNHELSHARQNVLAKGKEYNSIGLAYIIKQINDDRLEDYRCNHDADETEINADENGWAYTEDILRKYVKEDREFSKICSDNIRACVNRRGFSHKKTSKTENKSTYHGVYDIEEAKESIKNGDDAIFKTYPQLSLIFKKNGETNYKCLCIKKFVDNWDRLGGTSEQSFGNEMGHYIVMKEGRELIEYINNNNFSYDEIIQVVANLNELLHADAYYLRRLQKINVDQYDNTSTQFDIKNNLNYMYTYFFHRNMVTLNNLRKIYKAIKDKYPSINEKELYQNSWNAEYFYEIMESTDAFDESFSSKIKNCLDAYKQRGDRYLKSLAEEIEKNITFTKNNDSNNTFGPR